MALQNNINWEYVTYLGSGAVFVIAQYFYNSTKRAVIGFPSPPSVVIPETNFVYALEKQPSLCYTDKFGDLELASVLPFVQDEPTVETNKTTCVPGRYGDFEFRKIFDYTCWSEAGSYLTDLLFNIVAWLISFGVEMLEAIPLFIAIEWLNEHIKKTGMHFIDLLLVLLYLILRYLRRYLRVCIVWIFKDDFVSIVEHKQMAMQLEGARSVIREVSDSLVEFSQLRSLIREYKEELDVVRNDNQNNVQKSDLKQTKEDVTRLQTALQNMQSSLSSSNQKFNETISGILANFNQFLETVHGVDIRQIQEDALFKEPTPPIIERLDKLESDVQKLRIKSHTQKLQECKCADEIKDLSQRFEQMKEVRSNPESTSEPSPQSSKRPPSPTICEHTSTISDLRRDLGFVNALLRGYSTRNVNLKSSFEQRLANTEKEDLPGNVAALLWYVSNEFEHIALQQQGARPVMGGPAPFRPGGGNFGGPSAGFPGATGGGYAGGPGGFPSPGAGTFGGNAGRTPPPGSGFGGGSSGNQTSGGPPRGGHPPGAAGAGLGPSGYAKR